MGRLDSQTYGCNNELREVLMVPWWMEGSATTLNEAVSITSIVSISSAFVMSVLYNCCLFYFLHY